MRPNFGQTDLDCELVFDRDLAADDTLTVFQEALVELAPRWVSKMRIWRGPRDQQSIDAGRLGALRAGLVAATDERGPTYRSPVDRYGAPPFERLAGSAELRGSGPELVAVVWVDSMIVSPLGAAGSLATGLRSRSVGQRLAGHRLSCAARGIRGAMRQTVPSMGLGRPRG